MSAPPAPARAAPAFSPAVILALVIVGVIAFSGFAVLSAYAPELRQVGGPGAHALSRSAVGYAGVRVLLDGQGVEERVSRSKTPYGEGQGDPPLLVLTPPAHARPQDLKPYLKFTPVLIVLPKWKAAADPVRPDFVRKAGLIGDPAAGMLQEIAPGAKLSQRKGRSAPRLEGTEFLFRSAVADRLGEIDRLQTLSAPGLKPAVVDEQGAAVLACTSDEAEICVLADPDLLNTQGMKSPATASSGLDILNRLRAPGGAVVFDVSLNGIQSERNLLKLLFTPPLLGFTLCAAAAAALMGWHALARFGPTARARR
ncbi:MAG: hypothetical protein ABW042_09525, partial [Phenylobacterium sp.]